MRYTGTLVAPYWRFRRTAEGVAADVMGCHWTCDHCWSRFGWWSVRPRHELDPGGVMEMVALYHGADALLVTGGEPGLYWSHMIDVAARCKLWGVAFTVETAGVIVGPSELDELDAAVAGEATVVVGVKASSGERLAELTGLPVAVAERQHERQMDTAFYAAKHTNLRARATFLDRFTERSFVASTYRAGVEVEVMRYRPTSKPHRFYTPKRHRRKVT